MSCRKSKFSNKRTIKTKINKLIKAGHWSKKDKSVRIYYCEDCKAWHMTSNMDFDPSAKQVEVITNFKDRWNNLINDVCE
jgi:hypothetical protein